MKTILFTLCDGAFNYGGKLTVVGTYDRITIPAIPGSPKTSFALKFRVPVSELDQNAEIRVEFVDANGNPVSGPVSKSVGIPESDTGNIHLAMVGSVQLNISETGTHKMICYIDNRQVEELEFYVTTQ